jgi:hypothetical protein
MVPGIVSGPAAELLSRDRPRRQPLSESEMAQASQKFAALVAGAGRDRFVCARDACAAIVGDGWRIVTLDRSELTGIACDLADLLIVSQRPAFDTCRSGARLLSSQSLRATGSLEITLKDRSARMLEITPSFAGPPRPWTRHRLYDWRSGTIADSHSKALVK